ncbi:hypothetical protein WR25_01195 [Diploscapter pachys]|uniref:Uncharacterized protein n=1 Tax=Diploscapter pachys TaxID=2018661 RepID=A0A2A2KMJ3_9BILA|nr:hypothetical protein WR25_01195 [Diploscapter pachys]
MSPRPVQSSPRAKWLLRRLQTESTRLGTILQEFHILQNDFVRHAEERKWEGENGRGCRVESRPLESKQVDSEPEAEGVVREGAKDKGSCKFEKMDDVLLELEG